MNKQQKNQPVVLVVDDSPESLGMINAALEDAGLTILVSLNGAQALSIIQQIEPTVVLMDAMMPGMDGFETCRRLKQQLPLTPVIFMTGLTETEHLVAGFEAGGVDYITKPINPTELIVRLRTHVSNAQLISGARSALDTVKHYIMATDATGELLWLTPQCRTLLEDACLACGLDSNTLFNDQLPQLLQALLHHINNTQPDSPLAYQSASQSTSQADSTTLIIGEQAPHFSIQYVKKSTEDEYQFRLSSPQPKLSPEKLQNALPLTRREAEVLYWIAQGKTNREVATILDMSHRTVNKHLEQIYPKLNVDNRTSAAGKAMALSD